MANGERTGWRPSSAHWLVAPASGNMPIHRATKVPWFYFVLFCPAKHGVFFNRHSGLPSLLTTSWLEQDARLVVCCLLRCTIGPLRSYLAEEKGAPLGSAPPPPPFARARRTLMKPSYAPSSSPSSPLRGGPDQAHQGLFFLPVARSKRGGNVSASPKWRI